MNSLAKVLAVVCALVGGALVPAPLATTGAVQLSIEQLTARADLVVEGEVVSIESFEQDQKIFTEVQVRVLDPVKGEAARTVTLRLLGGTVGRQRMTVIGSPCISPGEQLVVFLVPNGPETFDLVNLAEGKFEVVAEPGQPLAVRRDLSGIAYRDPRVPDIPSTLAGLKAAVRAAAGAAR
jgi:hypothetical protein